MTDTDTVYFNGSALTLSKVVMTACGLRPNQFITEEQFKQAIRGNAELRLNEVERKAR